MISLRILGLTLLGLASMTAAAQANRIQICNDGNEQLSIALLSTNSQYHFGNPQWLAHGWYDLAPGQCRDAAIGMGRREMFASVRVVEGDRKVIRLYEVKQIPRDFSDDAFFGGAERLFCVKDTAFEREEATLEAHETCPAGFRLQVFNTYGFSLKDVRLKVKVK